MTTILGISAFYHDSAAALVVDGKVIAAAQEERFSRIKHDASFPTRSIECCLKIGGIDASEIDHVVFYEKPLLKFERILETHLANAPFGLSSFLESMPVWLRSKIFISQSISKHIKGYDRKVIFPEHHESHAASAFFPSPFESAAVLTVDGVGEWATTTMGVGNGNRIELSDEIRFPDSIGLLYSAFTAFCGFRVNGGEGKLMGLAPYGHPVYVETILNEILDLKDDGSFRLNQKFFSYCKRSEMTSREFANFFDGPPRAPESEVTDRERNLASSVQAVSEMVLLKIASHLHKKTGAKNLCLAGGVALNCVANGRLQRESPFEKVWVQPAAGDSGGAIGAALFVWHQLLGNDRVIDSKRSSLFLGHCDSPETLADFFRNGKMKVHRFDEEDQLYDFVVEKLDQQKIVGWFQGRMEFGPRALGNRSILADPRNETMKDRLNAKVKFRESFRPFAPVVLEAHCNDYFDVQSPSPSMTFAGKVKTGSANVPVGAVTHVDGSARVQTVGDENFSVALETPDPNLYGLLKKFEQVTGCPALINTSFNVRGEPIVCSVEDAYQCFLKTELDVLVAGPYVLCKENQQHIESESQRIAALNRQAELASGKVSFLKAILTTWQRITFPLRWVLSVLVLSLVYLFLVTPIGLLRRVLQRKQETGSSFWQPRKQVTKPSRYFKQF